jgi:hypothetical protein
VLRLQEEEKNFASRIRRLVVGAVGGIG